MAAFCPDRPRDTPPRVERDDHSANSIQRWHATVKHLYRKDTVELIRQLARVQPDQGIVSILNRLGLRTGRGNTWTEGRLRVFRNDHNIAIYEEGERGARGELTLEETAAILNVSKESVRRLIVNNILKAEQACSGAPWIIDRAEVLKIAAKTVTNGPPTISLNQFSLDFQ